MVAHSEASFSWRSGGSYGIIWHGQILEGGAYKTQVTISLGVDTKISQASVARQNSHLLRGLFYEACRINRWWIGKLNNKMKGFFIEFMTNDCLRKLRKNTISAFLLILLLITFRIFLFFSTSLAEEKSHATLQSSVTDALPKDAKISERIFGLSGLSNVGRVSPVIYRGAQPAPEGYATLKKMGIKTVINLRSNHSEKEVVKTAGMKSIEIPFNVLRDVETKRVNQVIDIMLAPENQAVYVHCRLGQDRTGIIIAAYRIRVEGWSYKNAEEEMQAFGFNDIWHELKEFIKRYAKRIGK